MDSGGFAMSGLIRIAPLIILTGSIALLGGAYAFQYIGGLAPCELCYYQRYPYMATIAVGLIGTWVVVASRGSRSSKSFVAALTHQAPLRFSTPYTWKPATVSSLPRATHS